MNRSRGRRIEGGSGHGDDLMITPLLDLFVALIPFLIISVVLTKINVVDVGISKPVASATKNPDNFDLLVKISDSSAEVMLNGKVIRSVTKAKDEKAWYFEVHKVLVDIKKTNPDQYKIRIEPKGKVSLQTIMGMMDGARKLKPEDGEILKKDAQGQPVKMQFLFPNVILRGIYT